MIRSPTSARDNERARILSIVSSLQKADVNSDTSAMIGEDISYSQEILKSCSRSNCQSCDNEEVGSNCTNHSIS